MFKLHRVFAVVSSVLALAAVAGCSTEGDTDSGSSGQEVNAAAAAPIARFAPYIKTLKSTLESGKSVEEIAQTLLQSGRPASFSLQALCRIYDKLDPKFSALRDDFKGLEDGIGGYDKWNSIYESAVSEKKDAPTLARLKTQRDDALDKFQKMLTEKKWLTTGGAPTHMTEVEDFLNGYAWKSRTDDRKFVLDHLIKEFSDMSETTYDMKILEVGDGVHELRRDVRWVLIEQLALNGMIVGKPAKEACPVPAYVGLENDGRYTSLKSSATEPTPCELNLCLVGAASKAVTKLGDVKDQAEIEVNIADAADVVPVKLQPEAQAVYDDVVKNDLFGQYLKQLNACKAAL